MWGYNSPVGGPTYFSKIGLQLRYYRVLSKALLGFSVPDNQPSMTAHYAYAIWVPTPGRIRLVRCVIRTRVALSVTAFPFLSEKGEKGVSGGAQTRRNSLHLDDEITPKVVFGHILVRPRP